MKKDELIDFLVSEIGKNGGVAPEFEKMWRRFQADEEIPNPNDFAVFWGSYEQAAAELEAKVRTGKNPHLPPEVDFINNKNELFDASAAEKRRAKWMRLFSAKRQREIDEREAERRLERARLIKNLLRFKKDHHRLPVSREFPNEEYDLPRFSVVKRLLGKYRSTRNAIVEKAEKAEEAEKVGEPIAKDTQEVQPLRSVLITLKVIEDEKETLFASLVVPSAKSSVGLSIDLK